jgi:hypothetical protein
MIRAARIAQERAHRQTTWHCWAYVKDALLAANVVATRPRSAWARQAGDELVQRFGFKRLLRSDPRRAPVGAVVVYGGPMRATSSCARRDGFVSDFFSPTPYPRPVIGIFVKQSVAQRKVSVLGKADNARWTTSHRKTRSLVNETGHNVVVHDEAAADVEDRFSHASKTEALVSALCPGVGLVDLERTSLAPFCAATTNTRTSISCPRPLPWNSGADTACSASRRNLHRR